MVLFFLFRIKLQSFKWKNEAIGTYFDSPKTACFITLADSSHKFYSSTTTNRPLIIDV